RIRTDILFLPVQWRPLFVISLQRQLVINRLIPEKLTPGSQSRSGPNQALPIIVADLMPEMSEQRPIRFMQTNAAAFPLVAVRLPHVDRDHSTAMAGFHG